MLKSREEQFSERMRDYALRDNQPVPEGSLYAPSSRQMDYAPHFSNTVIPIGTASDGSYIINRQDVRDA